MNHKIILLLIFAACFFIAVFYIIKNKPDYLVLLGIRGLLSYLLIKFINAVCHAASLSAVLSANPVSIAAGAVLGFPGILLLYLSKLYLL